MAKKLRVSERFLLGLALTVDSFINFRRIGMSIYRRRYFGPWIGPDYKPSNFYKTVSRLLKTGYIEKVIKDGKPYLRLTNHGETILKRDFPFFKMQKRKWDGKWRIVIFDIKEEDKSLRKSLRNKLKELGFGMLQKSTYISPYDFVQDMVEFLKTEKLFGRVFILTAKHQLMGDAQDLANHVWKIDKLEEKYDELLYEINSLEDIKENREKSIAAIKEKYIEILLEDPCLPYDFLGKCWIGDRVRQIVGKLQF